PKMEGCADAPRRAGASMGQARRAHVDEHAAGGQAASGAIEGFVVMSVKAMTDSKQRNLAALVGRFRDDEEGATAIEYSLIVGLIFLAIVAAVRSYTDSTSEMYQEIEDTLENG
ncbi:MAG: Flp family type IVb pilin, partial [Pseudomonadota bacterium]